MGAVDFTRQSGILPQEIMDRTSVAIVGAGAVGSHVAEVLAKMGIRTLRVFDDDTVEAHNLPNQGYFLGDLGLPKVEALKRRLGEGLGATVIAENRRVDENEVFEEDFIISAVDSMASRKVVWEAVKNSPRATHFVDGRMGARQGQVFYADLTDKESQDKYWSSWFPDDEGYQAPCTEKATIFCAYGLSSLIGSVIARRILDYEVRFTTEVDFESIQLFRLT